MKIDNLGTVNRATNFEQADVANKLAQTEAFAEKLQKEYNKVDAQTLPADDKEQQKLRKTCQDMESVFINLMFTNMRNTVQRSELLPESMGEKIMRSMLDQEMATKMSRAGGIGLADLLYQQLSTDNKKVIKAEK
ncbi:rod-binding protein [Succinispira mobilis]|uniref:rod-binding protein n=1 Tax=Succinispira mobilis TaxID=78120 RepID=UPI00037E87DC|nr:rod-binding protein [Succinispira mobilis]